MAKTKQAASAYVHAGGDPPVPDEGLIAAAVALFEPQGELKDVSVHARDVHGTNAKGQLVVISREIATAYARQSGYEFDPAEADA